MTIYNITIERIYPEACGDWHDRPVKYLVSGPGREQQKFSTAKAAIKYRSIRRKAASQQAAINQFVREG